MRYLIAILTISFLATASLVAQGDRASDDIPDEKLTKKQAEIRIGEFMERVRILKSELDAINMESKNLEAQIATTVSNTKSCNDALYALIGANAADVNAFRERLGRLEAKVRQMQRMSDADLLARQNEVDELENELNSLKGSKISVLPEFFDKIVGLDRDIKGLRREKKVEGYTVGTWAEDKDCLWNIAGKSTIYSDPFKWPKIWQANTDQIRNPDIIFPGQVLMIPVNSDKTSDEMKAERSYFRKKRAARAAATEAGNADATTKTK